VRVLSVLSASLLSALLVLFARRFLPLWAAALAGVMTALGHDFVVHGRELRAYALLTLTVLLLAYALIWAAERPTRRRLIVLGASVAAGSMTHYFFMFSFAAGLLWVWTSTGSRTRIRLTIAMLAGLLPLVLWAPWLVKQHHRASYRYLIGQFSLRKTVEAYWLMFARNVPQAAHVHTLAPAALLVAVVAGAAVLWRSGPSGRLSGLMAVVPLLLAAVAWSLGQPIFDVRNLLGTGAFAAVCIGALLARIPRDAGSVAAAGIAVILAVAYVRVDNHRASPAFEDISHALAAEGWTSTDPILVPHGMWSLPLSWYLPSPFGASQQTSGACGALFTVTASRFTERRLIGNAAGADVRRRVVGGYLILRLPAAADLQGVPKGEHMVNRVCTLPPLPKLHG
jgi:uncharacterized membrane protein